MPHENALQWLPDGGMRQTLSLAGGNESEWTYNPAGMLTKKVHANGDQTTFAYDSAGRLLSETTPAGNQTWTYNLHGGVASWSVGGVQQFNIEQHDLLGRPTRISDASGLREIVYDNDTWTLDIVEWTDGPLEGFKLDENADTRGRLGTVTFSKSGSTLYSVSYTYRGTSEQIDTLTVSAPGIPTVSIDVNGPGGVADQLIYSVNGQNTFTYARSRNGDGRLNGISAPGFSQTWNFDAMGRVHQLTTNGKPTTYGYDAVNGSLASAASPDELRLFSFNNRGELQEEVINGETFAMLANANQSGATANRENLRKLSLRGTFHTNAVVQVFVFTNLLHTATITPFVYTLDENNVPALANTNAVVSIDWSVVGTRPGAEYIGGNAVAEIAGQHLFAPASEPISYDIASRRSSDAFLNYSWNEANQPLMLEQRHGPMRVENVYDGQQRRVEKRVYKHGNLQQVHRFVYDGWLPVVEEVTDKWDNLQYRNLYVWGPGPDGVRNPAIGATGQLALIIHQPKTGPAQLSAPVYNHRLDVVGLVDVETGAVVARYGYTPFGETTHAVGPRADQNPFRFAGAYLDTETDTAYFGYRHYHPRSKQWISRDPIGEAGGLNLFAYADNDPINGIDVLGLLSPSPITLSPASNYWNRPGFPGPIPSTGYSLIDHPGFTRANPDPWHQFGTTGVMVEKNGISKLQAVRAKMTTAELPESIRSNPSAVLWHEIQLYTLNRMITETQPQIVSPNSAARPLQNYTETASFYERNFSAFLNDPSSQVRLPFKIVVSNADYVTYQDINGQILTVPKNEFISFYSSQSHSPIKLNTITGLGIFDNTTFNALFNPGPLAAMKGNPAANFAGGRYRIVDLSEDLVLYRGGQAGGDRNAYGQWFTREEPKSRAEVHIDSAVKRYWIDPSSGALVGQSPIEVVYALKIPKGTRIYEGTVGYQGGVYIGGGQQVFIPEPWLIKGVKVLRESHLP